MPQSDTAQKASHLDLVVYPHRSFKPEHFNKLLLTLLIICGLAAIRFTIVGAWPVAAFLMLDLLAIWLAFYVNNRRARICETIELTDSRLKVSRTAPNGHVESWVFEPYWVKVKLINDDKNTNRLDVSLHDQSVSLGTFLTPRERKQLYQKVQGELTSWKNRHPALQ